MTTMTKARICAAMIILLTFLLGWINTGCGQTQNDRIPVENIPMIAPPDVELKEGEMKLFLIQPDGSMVEQEIGEGSEVDEFSQYLKTLETIESMRNVAEQLIHMDCKDQNPPGIWRSNRSERISCIMIESLAMKRVMSILVKLADEMYYYDRPVSDIQADHDVLKGIIDSFGEFPNWQEVYHMYQQYLAGEDYNAR